MKYPLLPDWKWNSQKLLKLSVSLKGLHLINPLLMAAEIRLLFSPLWSSLPLSSLSLISQDEDVHWMASVKGCLAGPLLRHPQLCEDIKNFDVCVRDLYRQPAERGSNRSQANTQVGQALLSKGRKSMSSLLSGHAALHSAHTQQLQMWWGQAEWHLRRLVCRAVYFDCKWKCRLLWMQNKRSRLWTIWLSTSFHANIS